jgi:hypothetical protein
MRLPSEWTAAEVASINSTLASLTNAGNTRGVTIFVTGTCRENIAIGAFDHLAQEASPIATIQDQTNGSQPVVVVFNSYGLSRRATLSITLFNPLGLLEIEDKQVCTVREGT